LAPGWVLELIRDPRIIAAAVANATTALMMGLSAATQRVVFCYVSQTFEDRHFTKREISSPRFGIFPNLATIFRRSRPPPDGLASPRRVCPSANVASSNCTSCDHPLPFITTQ